MISFKSFCCASYAFSDALCRASAPFRKFHTSPLCGTIWLVKWSKCKTSQPTPDTKSAL